MFTKTRIKWGITIIMAGILLALALIGGNWGTTYAADGGVNTLLPLPHIDTIFPTRVCAGSADTPLFINGTTFNVPNTTDTSHTAVRITGTGVDQLLTQSVVFSSYISTKIPANLLVTPFVQYMITVVRSDEHTVPTIPVTGWDAESNQVPFLVIGCSYIPVVSR